MQSFAAAYQHQRNDEWLDRVIGDIIDPAQRMNCRDFGWDSDDDMVDDPDDVSDSDLQQDSKSESDRAARVSSPVSPGSFVTAPGSTRPWSPSIPSPNVPMRRSSNRSSRPNRSQQRSKSNKSHSRVFSDRTSASLISPLSMRSGDRARNSRLYYDGTVAAPSSLIPEDAPRSPAPPYEQIAKPQKSLHRSVSSQGWEKLEFGRELHRSASRLSVVSEFSGFAPHPGVRPLEKREVLGEAAGPSEDETEYPAPLALTAIIIGICMSVFIISLNRNVIATAIPHITERFHSYEDIGWYGSAYLLTASAFQPLYGRIYMSFETKQSFLAALAVFELGSLICAISVSSNVLIVGRAIQGVGSAGILTGAFVICTYAVRLAKRPILFAGVGILFGVGALCGPLVGGALTDTIGWRWCFWINLPVGGLTFAAVLLCFKRRTSTETREVFFKRVLSLDLIGNVILLGATTMLFLALQFSEQRYAWSSARCVGLLCGFAVTTLIFIAWMIYRGDAALLPPKIICQRTVAASCGAAFFIYGTLLLHAYYLPIWFQAIKGNSALQSGVHMIPYMAANALFSLLAGVFVSKNGLFAPPAIVGCAIGSIGCGLLATLHPKSSTGQWVGYEILISGGLGLAIQQGFSAVQTALPLEEVPIGTAAVVACQSFGGAIFVTVGNTVLQNHLLAQNNVHRIPGVNVRTVIEQGTTQFRKYVPPDVLPELIKLYNESLQGVFITAVPLCGLAFLCSLCMEWKSVRQGHADGKDAVQKTVGAEEVSA